MKGGCLLEKNEDIQLVLDTCLMAGKIMTESGSEVYRVEDTMNRIAENAGQKESVSYVTVTGLFMGFRSSHYTQLENVTERSINLEKVARVNHLSRQFAAREITIEELNKRLKNMEHDVPSFSIPLRIVAAGIVSCTLMYIFGGNWQDFLPTFLIGMIGYSLSLFTQLWLNIKFLDDFLAALAIGFLAYVAVTLHLANNIDNIIIGAIMPLVPGVAITNSFRDILAGNILSGTARAIEAIFVAGSIGIGIAIVFKLFM